MVEPHVTSSLTMLSLAGTCSVSSSRSSPGAGETSCSLT